jgi:hypothetical protein
LSIEKSIEKTENNFVNGMSTITIGQFPGDWELITVTETDRTYGYGYAFAAAQVAATSVTALATLGAGCAAAQGSRIAGAVVQTVHVLEGANAVNNVITGVNNIAQNGLTLANAVQVGTGIITMTGLKATVCFTAETQVVTDKETREKPISPKPPQPKSSTKQISYSHLQE